MAHFNLSDETFARIRGATLDWGLPFAFSAFMHGAVQLPDGRWTIDLEDKHFQGINGHRKKDETDDQLIARLMEESPKFAPLADELRRGLSDPSRLDLTSRFMRVGFKHAERKFRESIMVKCRLVQAHLHRAHRMVLDDDFVRAAVRLSKEHPEYILRALQVALPPFETLWLEWDEHVRVKELSGYVNVDGAARQVGFLIHRDTGNFKSDHPQYSVMVVWRSYQKAPFITPTGFSYAPMDPNYQRNQAEAVRLGKLRGAVPGTVFDKGIRADPESEHHSNRVLLGVDYWEQVQKKYPGCEPYLNAIAEHAVLTTIGPLGKLLLEIMYSADTHGQTQIRDDAYDEIIAHNTSLTGDFRFLVCALALLNTGPEKQLSFKPAPFRGSAVPRPQPAYEYRIVSLVRPVNKVVKRTIRAVSHLPLPRRYHSVMGSWHHSRKKGDPDCRIDPRPGEGLPGHSYHRRLDDEGKTKGSDQHVCAKCGRLAWWVKAHGRGDKKLGIVDKGYVIEGGTKHKSRRVQTVREIETLPKGASHDAK